MIPIIDPKTGKSISEPVIDLTAGEDHATGAHYSKQWGAETGYTKFINNAPKAASLTLARQLGWVDLFERIRERGAKTGTTVYDAACGFGLIHDDLFADPIPVKLRYVGADVHNSLSEINRSDHARFVRWDISSPLPTPERFDFVICRAAIHHTPAPEQTFRSLVSVLKPGGTLAISVYTKKTPMREASDEALRAAIVPLSPDEAFGLVGQFSKLGRDLQRSSGEIVISDDLPFLRIKAGRYPIQQFIYDHFLKCWFNDAFGEWSDIVNFDWYHPPYAYRYDLTECEAWYENAGLKLVHSESNKAQHYLEGVLR